MGHLPFPFNLMQIIYSLQTLTTTFGLKLTYDGSDTLKVWISVAYWNNTGGLCGTFDNDKTNEFRLKDGSLVYNLNDKVI